MRVALPPPAMSKYLRFLLGCLLGGAGLAALLYVSGWILRPTLPEQPVKHAPDEVVEVEALRDVSFDPANLPRVQVEVDYSAGKSAPWFPKGESPILAGLVAEGKLPPVAERTGPEPVVLAGVDGLGNYGGTWLRAANAPGDVSVISWRLSGATLVRWSPLGYPVVPHIAKSWESSADLREWTFHLREGMRWSDGAPFTADDLLYWWEEDDAFMTETRPSWMRVGGKDGHLEKVDDHTVKFVFPEPNGIFLEQLTERREFFTPRHYLRQFHPKYDDQSLIKAAMAAKGLGTARALYSAMSDIRNPDCPRLWPWVYRTYKATPPEGFVRNPYYYAIDPAGNQLPYVDRVLFEIKSPQLIPLAAASGELTMQARHIRTDDYTMLMEQRKANHYQVYHWFSSVRSAFTLWPNLNRVSEPGKPETAAKAALLDEIGMTRRDSEGIRLAPDGTRVSTSFSPRIRKPGAT